MGMTIDNPIIAFGMSQKCLKTVAHKFHQLEEEGKLYTLLGASGSVTILNIIAGS